MEYNRNHRGEAPVYTVTGPDTLLPFLLAQVKGKSRNNVKSLLSRRLVAVDGVPVSRFDTPLATGQKVSILSSSAPRAGALPFPILNAIISSLSHLLTGASTHIASSHAQTTSVSSLLSCPPRRPFLLYSRYPHS